MEPPILQTIRNVRNEIRKLRDHYCHGDLYSLEENIMKTFKEEYVLEVYGCEDKSEVHDDMYNFWRN